MISWLCLVQPAVTGAKLLIALASTKPGWCGEVFTGVGLNALQLVVDGGDRQCTQLARTVLVGAVLAFEVANNGNHRGVLVIVVARVNRSVQINFNAVVGLV